jgi:prepilin-type N-terminal cleavage/methylation domain-containing protein
MMGVTPQIIIRKGREMNLRNKTKGFTIIEVVLVLAIAGLIFLIVFLALPALQRNQRDTQRRSDVGRAIAAVQTWQSNKNGINPTAAEMGGTQAAPGTFITSYLATGGSTFADPSGGAYWFSATAVATIAAAETNASNDTDGELGVARGVTCNGTAKASSISVIAKLEGGGFYCANN